MSSSVCEPVRHWLLSAFESVFCESEKLDDDMISLVDVKNICPPTNLDFGLSMKDINLEFAT